MCKKVLFFVLILSLILPAAAVGAANTDAEAVVRRSLFGEEPVYADGRFLSVSDGRLTNGEEEVVLHGVNLGGWLLLETWLSPFSDPEESMAHSDILTLLSKRFGTQQATELLNTYADSFITEDDFATIRSLGFNCVRIPFWYRNFMTAEGKWLTGSLNTNPGICRLDWAIEQCQKNGLYVILDMHGTPGGQSTNHSTGSIGKRELYQDKQAQQTMETLWTALAKRYRNCPTVAAYDIMNEPQNNTDGGPEPWTAEAIAQTNRIYYQLVTAIRKTDSRHIITLEGIWSLSYLPDPTTYGWQNMMYQLHIYDRDAESIAARVQEMLDARRELGVAVYVGEYNSFAEEERASDLYRRYHISRTKWTYKTVGREDNWGLFSKTTEKADPATASLAELKTLLGEEMRTENGFTLNQQEYQSLQP